MGRPALATVDDLDRLLDAPVADDKRDQALARIEQASELVRAYAGRDWLTDDGEAVSDVPGAIPGLVAGIVDRASRNPSGAVSETSGPFQRSFGPDAAARIYLTAGERSIIDHATGSTTGGIGVLTTTRGRVETPSVIPWWERGIGEVDAVEDYNPYLLWP